MRIEITPALEILIFRDGETIPFFSQPNWPDGSAWVDETEATNWGNAYLNWITEDSGYPEPPLRPGDWASYKAVVDAIGAQ
jgi:hypothetical protein